MTKAIATGVRYEVSGTIFNPWYEYPIITTTGPAGTTVQAADICTPSTFVLPEQHLLVVAGTRTLTFLPTSAAETGRNNIEHVRAFLMYRTFFNYNVSYVAFSTSNPLPEEVKSLRFSLLRTVRTEEPVDGGISIRHTTTKEFVDITATDVSAFIRALDPPLGHALEFYLRANEARYVLVEYYKAFESIAEALGGVHSAMKALRSYGVTDVERSNFTKLCNDQGGQPTDAGRHAAKPGVSVRRVDNRYPLMDLRFVREFEQATRFCRLVIDGYIQYRIGQP